MNTAVLSDKPVKTLNPFDPIWREDPYPLYREIHSRGGFVLADEGFYVAAGYSAVSAVLRDPKKFSSQNRMVRRKMTMGLAMSSFSQHLQQQDPPDHTPIRAIMSAAFSPARIVGMKARVQDLVDKLLAEPARHGGMDFSKDFSYPLPLSIVTGMLGIPEEDMLLFRDWGDAFALAQGRKVSPEAIANADHAMTEAQAYFRDMMNDRRKNPREDLMSDFVTLKHNGVGMTEQQILVNCPMLITAGHESTANLLANGMNAFFANPDQWAKLCADLSLVDGAIEESLRFDAPVQLSSRIANVDCEIAGVPIKADKSIAVAFGGANRDPETFVEPDRFDITRKIPAHMSFGMGRHFCLGAALARAEGVIALRTIAERFPNIRPAGEPVRLSTETVRGFASFPVQF